METTTTTTSTNFTLNSTLEEFLNLLPFDYIDLNTLLCCTTLGYKIYNNNVNNINPEEILKLITRDLLPEINKTINTTINSEISTIEKNNMNPMDISNEINKTLIYELASMKSYTDINSDSNTKMINKTIEDNSISIINTMKELINPKDIDDDNSSIKGAKGESYVLDMISEKYNVEKPNKESGDFIVSELFKSDEYSDISVMIEVKNYKNKVAKKEVSKFYRDLDKTFVSGGVFLSLSSEIVSFDRNLEFKMVSVKERLVPCIFVCTDNENLICQCIELIFAYARRGTGKYDINKKLNKVDNILTQINEIDNSILNIKKDIDSNLDKLRFKLLRFKYDIDMTMDKIRKNVLCSGHNIESSKNTFYKSIEDKVILSAFKSDEDRISFFRSVEPLLNEEFTITIEKADEITIHGLIDFTVKFDKTQIKINFKTDDLDDLDINPYKKYIITGKDITQIKYKFTKKKSTEEIKIIESNKSLILELANNIAIDI